MPLNIHKAEKPKIDLTNKNSLVAWLKNHAKELWNAFGSPPTFKDYDPQKVIDFIKNGIEKDNVYISPDKEKEVIDTIKSKVRNGRAAMQYVSNLYLRGAGLGLRDQKEELLRQIIREIIEGELSSFARRKNLQNKNKKPVKTTISQKDRLKSAKKANWGNNKDNKDNKLESIIREEIRKILKEDINYYKKIQAALKMKDDIKNTIKNEKQKPTFKKNSSQGNFFLNTLNKRLNDKEKEIEDLKKKKKEQDKAKK